MSYCLKIIPLNRIFKLFIKIVFFFACCSFEVAESICEVEHSSGYSQLLKKEDRSNERQLSSLQR